MNTLIKIAMAMVLVVWLSANSSGVQRGFAFSGTVNFVFLGSPPSTPFGLPISEGTVVNGRFLYETSSPFTHDLADNTAGYRQQHLNGFWAEFGGVRVQADDYVIEIANDVDNPSFGTVNDIVTIRFSSDLVPSLELPLLVDGTPETVGQFSISLIADSDLYTDTSLPADLDPADFSLPPYANILSDQALPSSRGAFFHTQPVCTRESI